MPGDFEPTTGDLGSPSPDGSFGGAGAAGGILGTNPLQGVIEKFAGAVTTLDNAVSKLPQTGMGGESQAGQFKLFPGVQNQFESHSPGYFGSSSAAEFGAVNYFGAGPSTPSNGGQSAPGEQQPGQGGPTGGSGSGSQGGGKAPSVGGFLGSTATFTGNMGLQALSGQNALNTYAFQSSLMGSNASQQQLMQQAVGTFSNGNGGTNLNFTGTSTQDLAQETAIQQQIAGSANIMGTQAGQAGVGMTNAFSLANPTMNGTSAAQASQGMMMPSTSLRMRMMGYPVTPRTPGRAGANSSASVTQGMLQYMGLSGKSNKQIAGTLQPGGMGYVDLTQGLGLSGAQASQQANSMLAYNALFQGGASGQNQAKLDPTQAQQLINQYSRGSLSQRNQAGQTLQRYGIPESNLAALKTKAGAAAGAAGDLEPSYAKGLQDSIKALNTFKSDLMSLLDKSGLTGVLGSVLGAGSQLGGSAASAFGLYKLGKGAFGLGKKIFKTSSKGAEDAGKGVDDVGGDVGDAGGSGIEGGPEAVLGMIAGMGLDKAMATLPGKYGKKMGQTFSLHTLLKDIEGPFGGGPNNQGGGAAGAADAGMVGQRQSRNNKIQTASAQAKKAVEQAESQEGTPYQYGGEQPGQGFDCAGLTQWSYKQAGIDMPRTANQQYKYWKEQNRLVPLNEVMEGDLVFGRDATGADGQHVAIMATGNKIVTADTTGTPVRMRNFDQSEWQYAARPSGPMAGFGKFKSSTRNQATAGTQGSSLANPNPLAALMPGAPGTGIGDEALTDQTESGSVAGANSGGISAGSGYYGSKIGGSSTPAPAAAATPSSSSATTQTAGSAAMGGAATAGVTAWVGERGPELVHFQQAGTVLTAAQSQQLASGTISKPANSSSNELLCSTLNPLFGGGGGTGATTLNFNPGSISFKQNMSAGQSTPTGDFKDGAPTTGMSGRSQYNQTRRWMKKMDQYEAIATGES